MYIGDNQNPKRFFKNKSGIITHNHFIKKFVDQNKVLSDRFFSQYAAEIFNCLKEMTKRKGQQHTLKILLSNSIR